MIVSFRFHRTFFYQMIFHWFFFSKSQQHKNSKNYSIFAFMIRWFSTTKSTYKNRSHRSWLALMISFFRYYEWNEYICSLSKIRTVANCERKKFYDFSFLKPGTKHYYIVLIARLLNAVRQENTTSM